MSDQSKLSLRSLTIHRYEQFRNCPRIELSPDDNLILGINGSGKTSLLRLLAAVLRWNYDALLGQPFDVEFEQVLEQDDATATSIKGKVQYQPALRGTEQPLPDWRGALSKYDGFEAYFDISSSERAYVIEVRNSRFHVKQDGEVLIGDEPVESLLADLLSNIRDFALLPLWNCTRHTFLIRETDIDFIELTTHIPYDFLIDRRPGRPVPPALNLGFSKPEYQQWRSLVRMLIAGIRDERGKEKYLPPITYGRDTATELNAMLMALDAESISFRLKIEQTQSFSDEVTFEGQGVEIGVRFSSGTEVIDSRLTFGQKRLITIALGALLCGGSPLLVDELDNGLHPGLVEKVLGLIRGRQTFIASHNKLVVDLLDYESPEDMRCTIHVCRRNQDGTQSLVALSDEQVREVFEKIEVGIMNPSDVLLQEGLW